MLVAVLTTVLQRFADAPANCTTSFFGIPTWYKYLPSTDFQGCLVNNFDFPGDFSYIAIAAVDIALFISGMVAVFYVIYGGIQYVISQGEPDKTRGAKNTITNALVGLVLAGIAISIVSFVGSQIGKS
jgi:hypothetical protein